MSDMRHRNVSWNLRVDSDGTLRWEAVTVAVLMDIRDELQILNRLLGCPNFIAIPGVLRGIRRNTAKSKKRKA